MKIGTHIGARPRLHSKMKVGARVLLAGGVLSLAVGLFVVRAEEPGITYARSYSYTKIDLTVDSEASYNGAPWPAGTWGLKDLQPNVDKFFNFSDIKPGDRGENTISLHTNKEAWVCLEFLNLEQEENGENEPELEAEGSPPSSLEDEGGGELGKWMHFFAWRDDGDNVFEIGEKPILGPVSAKDGLDNKVYPVADYNNGPAIPANTTKHFGIYWCAGDLSVDVPTATITCDGEPMGNEAQTDSMSVDVQLVALPKSDKPYFKCSDIYLPPPGEQCDIGSVTIKNENNATIINNTTSSSNTGGNSTSGGTVVTGDASSTATTTNIINTNIFNFFKKK
ncbi:MAG: hypothetical protein Q8P58_02140 [Candidatus Adlerbacteria bacterium]|nr:hypothetical protein [Candidatus Adlerbacteria bacterium]